MRLGFENDAVLVELGEDRGDLALAEGVVERVVDGLRQNVQPRGSLAVNVDGNLQAAGLLVAGDVGEFRQCALAFVRSLGAHSASSASSASCSVY